MRDFLQSLPLAKGEPSPREKVRLTMLAFKDGRLRGNGGQDQHGNPRPGPVITNRKQAIAIALATNGLKKAFEETDHPRDENGRWSAAAIGGAVVGAKLAGQTGYDVAGAIAGRPLSAVAAIRARKYPLLQQIHEAATSNKWVAGHAGIALARFGYGSAKYKFVAGMSDDELPRWVEEAAARQTAAHGPGPLPTAHLWRGEHGAGAARWNKAKAGDTVRFDPPTSWSREPSVASHFTRYSYMDAKPGDAPLIPKFVFSFTKQPYQSPGAKLTEAVGGPNLPKGTPKTRVFLRGVPSSHFADIPDTMQHEVAMRRGARMVVDKVRQNKAGDRVIFARMLGLDTKNAFRRAVLRRFLSPSFQGGRLAGAATLGTLAGLGAWAFRSAPPVAPAAPMAKAAPDTSCCADERVAGMLPHADRLLHRAGQAHSGGASDPHVAAMMPDVRRLLGTVQVATPRSRLENNASVADHRSSLSHLTS
jgi:hypothetical protein